MIRSVTRGLRDLGFQCSRTPRVVGAQEAVRLGIADRVATLEQTVVRLLGNGVSQSQNRVEFEPVPLEAILEQPPGESQDGQQLIDLRRLAMLR